MPGRDNIVVTFGAELEFMLVDCDGSELLRRYGLHRDYGLAFEVGTPVGESDRIEDVIGEYLRIEGEVANTGYRVHYARIRGNYSGICGTSNDRRPMSAHLHFAVRPYSPEIMARLHNWLVVLASLLAPLFILPLSLQCVEECSDCDAYECWNCAFRCTPRINNWYRQRIDHFAAVPAYATTETYRVPLTTDVNYRGYRPYHVNSYYGVELNKYRKNVVTVELRTNEQAVVIAAFMSYILERLIRFKPPLILPTTRLWEAVYSPITIELRGAARTIVYRNSSEGVLWRSAVLVSDDVGLFDDGDMTLVELADRIAATVDHGDAPWWLGKFIDIIKSSYYLERRVETYPRLIELAASLVDNADARAAAERAISEYNALVEKARKGGTITL